MVFTAVALSALLQAAVPAATTEGGYSWCVADAAGPSGKVRFFSDPFEGETDVNVEGAFREYVDRSYSRTKKTGGYTVSCRFFSSLAAANAALKTDSAVGPGTTDVMTAWRFHFE